MRYKVAKTDIINPDINSPEWEKADVGIIGVNRWKEFQEAPETTFRVLQDNDGITVKMHTKERNLRAVCETENGDVYLDSCMEFFLKPDPWDTRFLNFELNPKGVLHLGLGPNGEDRVFIEERDSFDIVSVGNEGDWTLKVHVPFEFLKKYFKNVGKIWKGNFYKCGDMTDHVHFGAWSEIEVPEPDFHVPDFFGIIEL